MASGTHTIKVNYPISKVWEFVSDINKWAPLVPGYIEHIIISENKLTWKFVSDIGIMKRTLHMDVKITNWQEPTKVTFNLKGINENFTGDGSFEAVSINDTETQITGFLNITAGGMLSPAINPVLKTVIPKTTTELTQAIGRAI
ncbi:CoxG family protein [Oceanobacillus bengalensis]|uniref:SRPBCC family protein n=1 Tax=Oceanobacillus bengalensis TaxID=1435466 RepID=A0A494YS51_9BACI|nr:SRPBCC family protein [Oceanobacillus bengalensis]RKQ12465.1 SRPBCC family protein [Oceanobacillus bengalensis]